MASGRRKRQAQGLPEPKMPKRAGRMTAREERKAFQTRFGQLRNDREPWTDHWDEISLATNPRRFRRHPWNRSKHGSARSGKIYNSTGTKSLRVLASGLLGGVTTPSRPWFRLTLQDPELMERYDVRTWLSTVEDTLRSILASSNFYKSAAQGYLDLPTYGQFPMYIEEDDKSIIRCSVPMLGSYFLAQDHEGRVNTIYQHTTRTAKQLVDRFGMENVSQQCKRLYAKTPDATIEVMHVIEPNDDRIPQREDWIGKKFRSVWYETGNHEGILGVRGYTEFPVMVARWGTVGEEVYSEAPAMEALPDILSLQYLEKKRAQALEKIVNPPMNIPTGLRRRGNSLLAGGKSYTRTGEKVEPAHLVDPRVLTLDKEIDRIERRIKETLFEDIFRMLASATGPQMTAREVHERHEENVMQLGPVLESLHHEFLGPAIDRVFDIALRRGLIPVPPKELQGQDYEIELVSVLAQAQKLLGTVAIERLVGFGTTSEANGLAGAIDNLDPDGIMRQYARGLGSEPELLRSTKKVQELRDQRMQAQQAQQAAEFAQSASVTARNLGSAQFSDDTALARLLGEPVAA